MKKKLFTLILTAVMLLGALPALADVPAVEKIEYEGNGRVEIEFREDVKYRNFKLKVTDDTGKKYTATVLERDDDSISFKVSGFKAGREYSLVASGVKVRGTSGYGKVKTAFTVPAAGNPAVEDIEVKKNGRIEVDFHGKVQYKNLKVKIKDAGGKSYAVAVLKKDNDEINVKASGLKAGNEYTLVINGVRAKGGDEYVKIKIPFTTPAGYKENKPQTKLAIRSVDSDAGDDEIEVEFNKNVEYKNLKVTVKTASGKSMTSYVTDRDNDSVEIRVSGLTAGVKYTVKVQGVRISGSTGSYGSVSATFTARND